jgi:hypothetical protein
LQSPPLKHPKDSHEVDGPGVVVDKESVEKGALLDGCIVTEAVDENSVEYVNVESPRVDVEDA